MNQVTASTQFAAPTNAITPTKAAPQRFAHPAAPSTTPEDVACAQALLEFTPHASTSNSYTVTPTAPTKIKFISRSAKVRDVN